MPTSFISVRCTPVKGTTKKAAGMSLCAAASLSNLCQAIHLQAHCDKE